MKTRSLHTGLILSLALSLPLSAHAHKTWLEPSKTVLNVNQWVTVDAAASTDPFVKDHVALRLDSLSITAPDGTTVAPENVASGKLRSSFDLHLQQAGTYRIALVNDNVMASWKENGENRRWPPRGTPFTPEGFAREVPAKAEELRVTQSLSRLETFVTAGKPNDRALQPTGRGLELVPVSAVNDLYADEPATFQLVLDGKPAAGVEIELVADGIRYRNAVDEITLTTGADGRFTVEWPQPGLYWLSASTGDDRAEAPATRRRLGYTAVLEVLSP